jgi:hypothetical protein
MYCKQQVSATCSAYLYPTVTAQVGKWHSVLSVENKVASFLDLILDMQQQWKM